MRKLFLLTITASLLYACSMMSNDINRPEEMNRLEIAMRRLSAAVQGVLWSGTPQDSDLIAITCKTDPSLCNALGDNTIRSKVVDGNAVLLLCTPDGARALVEDIACTPTPDRKAWTTNHTPCAFTIPDQTIRATCR